MNGWQYNPTKFQFEHWYNDRITAICTREVWNYYWSTEGWGRYAERGRLQNHAKENA